MYVSMQRRPLLRSSRRFTCIPLAPVLPPRKLMYVHVCIQYMFIYNVYVYRYTYVYMERESLQFTCIPLAPSKLMYVWIYFQYVCMWVYLCIYRESEFVAIHKYPFGASLTARKLYVRIYIHIHIYI